MMFYDTQKSPPAYVVIGIVHGGSICSGFFKNLIFPEIFVRTEDSEVLEFITNIMEYEYDIYDDDICKTDSGSEANKECKFPFTFRGTEYNSCINGSRRRKHWCPTQLDENGTYVFGKWGYCDTKLCPLGKYVGEMKIIGRKIIINLFYFLFIIILELSSPIPIPTIKPSPKIGKSGFNLLLQLSILSIFD